jgi:hypothetical protein
LGRLSYHVGQCDITGRYMMVCCSVYRLVAKSSQLILSRRSAKLYQGQPLLGHINIVWKQFHATKMYIVVFTNKFTLYQLSNMKWIEHCLLCSLLGQDQPFLVSTRLTAALFKSWRFIELVLRVPSGCPSHCTSPLNISIRHTTHKPDDRVYICILNDI